MPPLRLLHQHAAAAPAIAMAPRELPTPIPAAAPLLSPLLFGLAGSFVFAGAVDCLGLADEVELDVDLGFELELELEVVDD